jgi:hypothetical protein
MKKREIIVEINRQTDIINESRREGVKESRSQGVKESRSQGVKESKSEEIKESRRQGVKESRSQEVKESEKLPLASANRNIAYAMQASLHSKNLHVDSTRMGVIVFLKQPQLCACNLGLFLY